MKNLRQLIRNNLCLKVDFKSRQEEVKGIIRKRTEFFLIGHLPILILYKNGQREKASLNTPIKVDRNPYLRTLEGARAGDRQKIGPYKNKIRRIISKLEKAFIKIIREGRLNGEPVEKILIINKQWPVKK